MEKQSKKKESLLTVPNLLSFYRLLSSPVVLYFIFSGQQTIFLILMLLNLVTDILDGLIARTFNLTTEFGAKLDSLADDFTYFLAFIGVILFKGTVFQPYLILLGIFLFLYFLSLLLSVVKFKKLPSLHLYFSKAAAYLQGLFFLVLFTIGFIPVLFYMVILISIVSFTEQIIVILISPEMKSDLKGLYWILKDK